MFNNCILYNKKLDIVAITVSKAIKTDRIEYNN